MDTHDGPQRGGTPDPFTKFWTDMMAAASTTAGGQAFAPSKDEALRQMRRAFLDAWAKSCDEFMHSEQFLELMKRSMDGSLALREQMNKFLAGTLQESAIRSPDNTDSTLQAVRTLEDRVVARIEEISRRVDGLEDQRSRSEGDAK